MTGDGGHVLALIEDEKRRGGRVCVVGNGPQWLEGRVLEQFGQEDVPAHSVESILEVDQQGDVVRRSRFEEALDTLDGALTAARHTDAKLCGAKDVDDGIVGAAGRIVQRQLEERLGHGDRAHATVVLGDADEFAGQQVVTDVMGNEAICDILYEHSKKSHTLVVATE